MSVASSARARRLASFALLVATSAHMGLAGARPMGSVDLFSGGGVRAQSGRDVEGVFAFGVFGALVFAPTPSSGHWTFPVGASLAAERFTHSAGVVSLAFTVMALGAPNRGLDAFEVSIGPAVQTIDSVDHYGVASRVSWGLWGAQDASFKIASARLFAEHHVVFGGADAQTMHEVIVGAQIDPILLIVLPFIALFSSMPNIGRN